MKKNRVTYIFIVVTSLAISCTVTRPYKTPAVEINALYRDSSTADTSNMANLHWTEVFSDTLLQNLIREGIGNNLNLKIAYTRIRQAQAYFEQSRLALLPNVGADVSTQNGTTSNTKTSTTPTNTHLYEL